MRVDEQGRIWTSHNRGGYAGPERRAEHDGARGYLHVSFRGKSYKAHRIVYAWHLGAVPAGVLVCHRDGNRTNNHPRNLDLGTNRDNMADAREAGAFTGDHARGERHHRTHLTDDDVRAMRSAFAEGRTGVELAIDYGISKSNVSFIVNRQTWRHVE